MKSSIETRVKDVMSSVFGMLKTDINNEASIGSIAAWDSLKHMNLIGALEEEFSIEINDHELESMVSYKIIVATLQAHLDDE